MYGIYINGRLVKKYKNPIEAYEAAKSAYSETGIFHEVRNYKNNMTIIEITDPNLVKKYEITLDGKKLTKNELKGAIDFVRELRKLG